MKTRIATSLVTLALSLLVAGASFAQASLVAGWDFSQYAGDGFMSIDGGGSFTNTLSANYSDLDPTFGAGFESAAFGTMFADGQFGSTAVSAGSGTEEFVPSAAVGGSLASNLEAPALLDFDAFSVLSSEGQVSTESLAMLAPAAASVVFEADLSGAGQTGTNWSLSLGARTTSGTSSVGVEFSSDGDAFTSAGTLNVTAVDSLFTVSLAAASSNHAFVRLSFAPSGVDQPLIDNLAISAELSSTTTTTTTTTPTTSTTSTTSSTTTTSTSTTAAPTTTTSTTGTGPTTTTTSTTSSTTGAPTTSTSTTVTTAPPTTTTTTTSAPATTSTTTTTAVPTTTTTAGLTTTTTTTTTTTSTTGTGPTTTSTTGTGPTTATTTLPSTSGQHAFQDRSGDANSSFIDVDLDAGQLCVAGQVQELDHEAEPFNRRVTIRYEASGPLALATNVKARAEPTSVVLNL